MKNNPKRRMNKEFYYIKTKMKNNPKEKNQQGTLSYQNKNVKQRQKEKQTEDKETRNFYRNIKNYKEQERKKLIKTLI